MRALKTLVIMQLKEKLDLKGKSFKSKKTLFSLIFSLIKFVGIVALCYLVLFACQFLQLFSLTGILPVSLMTVIFTIMIVISIITATMSLTKSMYYSYDNPVLLTLPCRATQVYLSKLIVFYIYEVIRNLSFMVPMFIAFGIINKLPIIYFPWIFICFIFISMIPVIVGAILSIPMMWFYNFFRQYKRLQAACLIIILSFVTLAVIKLISIIPTNIDIIGTWVTTYWNIQEFLEKFIVTFAMIHRVTVMLVGVRIGFEKVILFSMPNMITLLALIAVIVVLFALGLFVVKPLFYKMASKPFEYRKNNKVKSKPNRKLPKKVSSLKTEMLLSFRDAEKMFTNIAILVALPILIFFLNKLFAAMNTKSLGDNLAIVSNILIMLLITLSTNSTAASVFSRDGRSSYLIKVQPSKYQPLLLSKLVVNIIFITLAYIATFFVLVYASGLSTAAALFVVLACLFVYLSHLAYSAELDIMNPQIELYAAIGNSDSNPNETKSTLMAFLVSFISAFGLFIFLGEELGNGPYMKFMIIAFVFMILRILMLLTKIRLYYKEK